MPKETERTIKTDTEYFTQNGQVFRKVTIYTVLSNARIQGEPDEPSLSEVRDTIVGTDKDKKSGYSVGTKTSTVY